jgi:NADH dehydrogenase/NADH:ubiquinone oxidoreductase subunit G
MVSIDNIKFIYKPHVTIYQFCFANRIILPCFCYHEKLGIAGNCRICLIEANGVLGVSCSLPLVDSMQIFTDSLRVRQAREGVLEFLLVNHPLDCPICDQGGYCDLQNISQRFGADRGRFYEFTKKAITNLGCGSPFYKNFDDALYLLYSMC